MTDVFNFDFNSDGEQKSFDIIPDNTICTVQLTVRPGGAGPDGWLTRAKNGSSEHLNCEFTVVDGVYARRKFWTRLTVATTVTGANHGQAIEISRKTLKAVLESARGVRPDDAGDAAKTARQAKGWSEFDGLRFVVRVGVEPAKDDYPAKNTIREVITPERQAWKQPEQLDRDLLGKLPTAATAATAQPATTTTTAPAPAPAPANAIARPQWAS